MLAKNQDVHIIERENRPCQAVFRNSGIQSEEDWVGDVVRTSAAARGAGRSTVLMPAPIGPAGGELRDP